MEDFELAKNQVILLSFFILSTQTEIAQEWIKAERFGRNKRSYDLVATA
jgi:hypothetical protein